MQTEHVETILLVGDDFHAAPEFPLLRPEPGASWADAARACRPSTVLAHLHQPRLEALDQLRDMIGTHPCPVLVLVDHDLPGFADEAVQAGASSYLAEARESGEIRSALRAAGALWRRHSALEEQLRSAEKKLNERAVIERAKAALIRRHRFSEPEAYRWLQRRAMSQGRRIADLAAELLASTPERAPQ